MKEGREEGKKELGRIDWDGLGGRNWEKGTGKKGKL